MIEYIKKKREIQMGKKASIVFTGDIGFDRYMEKNGRMKIFFLPKY